jgi:hypothetical protein
MKKMNKQKFVIFTFSLPSSPVVSVSMSMACVERKFSFLFFAAAHKLLARRAFFFLLNFWRVATTFEIRNNQIRCYWLGGYNTTRRKEERKNHGHF